ncbi:phage shock protein A (PspA) family protein [Stackebrandtia endophytica]|uniref:Phage shock protein A (PspA) family protein n=1 Tax=Stackebrandtia endophytica TaxID=1496996 RepID=A0A543B0H0_9ACTN|nr:phage shock protein A (PspA) family protein [Stackebrandtia endophytica]
MGEIVTKQSIFGRVAQLAKANINAILDSAEDPGKMIDQLIRDYRDNIAEAEQSIAQTIGNLRLMEDDFKEDVDAATGWGQKAVIASDKAEELKAQGEDAEAAKFDQLARVALGKQIDAEKRAQQTEPAITSQTEVVAKLKDGLAQMKTKLGELQSKRDSLVARQQTAQAQTQVQEAMKSVGILDPSSEISRFEEKVRRQEARVRGAQELAESSLDAQFESLDDLANEADVEARLAALKSH